MTSNIIPMKVTKQRIRRNRRYVSSLIFGCRFWCLHLEFTFLIACVPFDLMFCPMVFITSGRAIYYDFPKHFFSLKCYYDFLTFFLFKLRMCFNSFVSCYFFNHTIYENLLYCSITILHIHKFGSLYITCNLGNQIF